MNSETTTLVDIETIRAAAARIANVAVKTPLVRAPVSRSLRLRHSQRDPPQGREPAAHRRIQNARRGQQDSAAHARRDRPRRHHLLQRQSRAGRGLCGARGGRQGRHRHALECARHQARGHAGARRRSGGRGRGLKRAPGHGREAGPRARLRRDPALRRRADHRRPGHLRPGDCRRVAGGRPGACAGERRRAARAAWPRRSSSCFRRSKVFGVEPELAGDTAESFRTGKIVTWGAELTSRTIADGLRTQSVGERNFAHIQAFVDGIITVTEAEIRAAMRAIVAATRLVPEPSGAVPVAALLFHAAELPAVPRGPWPSSAAAMWTPRCWPKCSRKNWGLRD